LEIEPNYAPAYNNRGAAYNGKGQYDRAISDLNKALEIQPKLAEAYFNRGFAYGRKGEWDHAIADFNRGIELKPKKDIGLAYYERAVVYYEIGEYEKAWNDVRRAQTLAHTVDPLFLKKLREASGRQEQR